MADGPEDHFETEIPTPQPFGWRLEACAADSYVLDTDAGGSVRPRVFGVTDERSRNLIQFEVVGGDDELVSTLNQLVSRLGTPCRLRCRDVAEFRSDLVVSWAATNKIPVEYISVAEIASEESESQARQAFRTILRTGPKRVN
jgi:hypothetical protein